MSDPKNQTYSQGPSPYSYNHTARTNRK